MRHLNRFSRDTKHDLRDDLVRLERIVDKVENDMHGVEDDAQSLMDRTKSSGSMIEDAKRFIDS